jgi:hypothetical protein
VPETSAARPQQPPANDLDRLERVDTVEQAGAVERPFLDFLEDDQDRECRRESDRTPGSTRPEPVNCRHQQEPRLEDIRKDEQHVPLAGQLERDETNKAVGVEGDGYGPFRPCPAQSNDEECREVDLVGPLVEGLVVRDPAKIEDVAKQEVGEVDEDREDAARQWPAQDRQ